MQIQTAAERIAELKAQLAEVAADLASAGRHKIGTKWHAHRVAEAMWLARAIERLERPAKSR